MARAKLTEKERRFVEAFMGKAVGNGTRAVLLAGYTKNRRSAGTLANRLLKKVEVQRAIAGRVQKREQTSILTAQERDEMLSRIARREEEVKPFAAQKAVAELNKCEGRHSMKLIHAGKLTLEQAIEKARE